MLWAISNPTRLTAEAARAIADSTNLVFVSPVSPWEIEIKRARRKLRAPQRIDDEIDRAGFDPLPITVDHAIAAGRLPLHHADPFDRMLVAQAQLEGLTIVTRDPRIARYQVAVLAA